MRLLLFVGVMSEWLSCLLIQSVDKCLSVA